MVHTTNPYNINTNLNKLVRVVFVTGFFGCMVLSISEAVKKNWQVSILAAIAMVMLYDQLLRVSSMTTSDGGKYDMTRKNHRKFI